MRWRGHDLQVFADLESCLQRDGKMDGGDETEMFTSKTGNENHRSLVISVPTAPSFLLSLWGECHSCKCEYTSLSWTPPEQPSLFPVASTSDSYSKCWLCYSLARELKSVYSTARLFSSVCPYPDGKHKTIVAQHYYKGMAQKRETVWLSAIFILNTLGFLICI